MDGVRGLGGIFGPGQVRERNGGGKQDAEAFRRALAGERDQAGDGGPSADDAGARQRAVTRRLQPPGRIDRRDDGEAVHIDVIA